MWYTLLSWKKWFVLLWTNFVIKIFQVCVYYWSNFEINIDIFRSVFTRELSVREEKILFLDSIKPYEVLQTQMYAIRRLFIPPAPETHGELDIHSKWFLINDQSIVIGDYLHSDGLRTLVCSTNECLEILSRAETIHGKNFLF